MVFFARKVIVNRDKWRKTSYLSNFDPTGGPLALWGSCGINPATELWWSILLWSQFFDRPPSKLMVVKLSKFFSQSMRPAPHQAIHLSRVSICFMSNFLFVAYGVVVLCYFENIFFLGLVKLKLMLLFQESFHSDNWTFWHWSSQKKYIADFLRWLHLIHGYYTCSLDCLSIFHAYFAQKICLQVFNSKLFRKFLLINLICYSSNTFKTCNEI